MRRAEEKVHWTFSLPNGCMVLLAPRRAYEVGMLITPAKQRIPHPVATSLYPGGCVLRYALYGERLEPISKFDIFVSRNI
jgi:hypothetical protein